MPDLWLTCDHCMGRVRYGQPTSPIQPFISSGR